MTTEASEGKQGEGPAPWTILLAEDNEDHALLIKMALERASRRPTEVEWVRDGDAALSALAEATPDLLILDLKMPGTTGHDVLEKVKTDERLRRIPVAVLTSSDRDEDIARSYGLGGNHFITKPDSPKELEDRLRTLLDNLPDLVMVRRGVGRMDATAVSDMRRPFFSLKNEVFLGLLIALIAVVVVWYVISG